MTTPSLTVTRDEAAAMLGVHYDTIRAMERRGDLHRSPTCSPASTGAIRCPT
jgi:hypothetical protein